MSMLLSRIGGRRTGACVINLNERRTRTRSVSVASSQKVHVNIPQINTSRSPAAAAAPPGSSKLLNMLMDPPPMPDLGKV